jgi:hypothetical protein
MGLIYPGKEILLAYFISGIDQLGGRLTNRTKQNQTNILDIGMAFKRPTVRSREAYQLSQWLGKFSGSFSFSMRTP